MGKSNGEAWIHYLGLLTPLLAPVAVGVIPGLALAGVVGGFLALCGSVSTQRVMEDLSRRARTAPPRGEELHNHHMALVAGHALLLALGKPRKEGGLARLGKELAPGLSKQLEALDESNVASRALQSLERLAMDLMQESGAPPEVDEARTRAWAGICDALHATARASDPTIIKMTDAQRDTLIEEIDAVVPHFIYELLKEDATGAGPAQGRAFPAFLMKRLEAVQDSVASASMDIQETVLEESRRILRRIMEAFASSSAEVRGMRGELGAFAGQINKDLASLRTHGLFSVRQYSIYFWEQALFGLDQLRNALALRRLVGREAERALFRDFLANGGARVLHWRAYPGVGKTRLALDHAEVAERSGWSVRFVSNTVQDLVQAVQQTWDGATSLCLIWDNYDGTKPEQLKAFLRIHDALQPLMGSRILCVLLAWPAHATADMAEFRLNESYVTRELAVLPSQGHSETSRWVAQLAPGLGEGVRSAVLQGAAGAPRSILVRLNAALSGTQVEALNVPGQVEKKHYDSIYLRLLRPSAEGAICRIRVLRGLALWGTIKYEVAKLRLALEMLGLTEGELDRASHDLLVTGCIAQDGAGIHLSSDDLRGHIIRYGHRLPREPDGSIQRLSRWLPAAIRLAPEATWGIVRYAFRDVGPLLLPEDGGLPKALGALLRGVDELIASATPETGTAVAVAIANITSVESAPSTRLDIAGRIATLRANHDTPDIAGAEALALGNATVGEPSAAACLEIAGRISILRARYDTAKIAEAEAGALSNATLTGVGPQACLGIAFDIAALRAKYKTARIAELEACALYNATVDQPDPRACLEIADRIASLRTNHDTHDIARMEAVVLCNAAVGERFPEARLKIAGRIESLRVKYDTPEIAQVEADALAGATIGEGSPKACLEIAGRIAGLRLKHNTPGIARAEAGALSNSTVVEPDPKACFAIAERIASLRVEYDTDEIADLEAGALSNATIIEHDLEACLVIAARLRVLAKNHDTPTIREIVSAIDS